MPACLYFVVPCYRDVDTLPVSVPVFEEKLRSLIENGTVSENSRLLLINDGSPDDTWETILRLQREYPRIAAMNLAKNAGEQNALLAGMFTAAGQADCVITMDSDLQDDIAAVDEMLRRYYEGNEIVFGVRSTRQKDPLGERIASGGFYWLMRVAGTGLLREHANYRLMSKKAVALLREYPAENYYLPCVVCGLGLKSAVVYHERFPRAAGSSGYNFIKKLRLALDAVFAHSRLPLRLIGFAALLWGLAGLGCGVGAIAAKSAVWGLFAAVFFTGALLLFAARILAEYAGKIFGEARRAPRFQIDAFFPSAGEAPPPEASPDAPEDKKA